ncbi:MAG: type II secretion system F family protein [Planctomycetota bacterium]|nr:MAG: type II secretion system F family protein [Planctomycetota bacterium]
MAVRIQRRVPAAERPAPAARRGRETAAATATGARVRRRVPAKHLARFTRLLATLTEAGLPILRNLRILTQQWPPGRLHDAVLDAADMVEEGQPLSEALGSHPEVFDELYVNMTRAGEAGGVLDKVLARLAEFLERSQQVRDRVRGALTYPIVVFLVAVGVVAALMIVVIPQFARLYDQMDVQLPALTLALIGISRFMARWWFLVLGLPVLAFVLYQMAYLRSLRFRRWNHAWWLRMPLMGGLIQQAQTARFATTFGTLVASGVPHLRAFEITRGSLGSEVYREAVDQVREEVREGESIAASLENTGHFDDVVVSMVEVGEQTGELDRMCLRVGQNYEDNFNRTLDILLKLLEPVMLIFMAGMVATIALALFLPLFKLLQQIGQPT